MSPKLKQKIFTYADFDLQKLCHLASTLRRASCVCDPDQRPASGSFNWAIFVLFDDGTRWVLKSPHERTSMPSNIGRKTLASEAATLLYLKAYSNIPVPEVFEYCDTSNNDIGIPFILMSEARGVQLSNFWRPASSPESTQGTCNKAKILSQLGAITWELSQLRFDKIGSLLEREGTFHTTECLSRSHVLYERFSLDIPRGPFCSETEFYDSVISAFLAHAETLSLSHHCFVAPVPKKNEYDTHSAYIQAVDLWNDFVTVGCKTESSTNRLDYIIVASALREIIQSHSLASDDRNSFPLYHADLSVNNIYVDEEYNITCIIDWGFASSVPEFMLLAPPGLPQFRDEISQDLYKSFIDGFIAAIPDSFDKIATHRYQKSLSYSQVSWRLTRLLSLDSLDDYSLFSTVWDFVHGPSTDLGQYLLAQRSSSHFSHIYRSIEQDDVPASQIKDKEQDYFDKEPLRYTIAKKLTLISEWNSQHETNSPRLRERMFLADSRLWKSIIQFMQIWEDNSSDRALV